jgi:hypothetical protein
MDATSLDQEHAWIEVTDPQTRPGFRVWMCNRHPGEQCEQKAWLPPPDRQDEVERLRGLLARLEWAGTLLFDEWYNTGKCCPVCRAEQGDAHTDCWLAKELGR